MTERPASKEARWSPIRFIEQRRHSRMDFSFWRRKLVYRQIQNCLNIKKDQWD